MAISHVHVALGQLGGLTRKRANSTSDQELLRRFATQGDGSAFTDLVRRHGPLVQGVCRSILGHEQDAEDAFQATFLVLARRAASIRKGGSLVAWLHGVAFRVAQKARTQASRRRRHESQAATREPNAVMDELTWRELRQVFHEELARLPEKLRAPLLLSYWEGLTQDETARRLDCPKGTVKERLERGRDLLRGRLTRRGLVPPVALFAAMLSREAAGALPPAAEKLIPGEATARATALVDGLLKGVVLTKVKVAAAVFLVLVALAVVGQRANPEASAGAEPAGLSPSAAERKPATDALGHPLPPGAVARLGSTRLQHGADVLSLAYSADGKDLASTCADGTIRLWDSATGEESRRCAGEAGRPQHVAFALRGRAVVAGGMGAAAQLWDRDTGKPLRRFAGPGHWAQAFAVSANGKTLATGADVLQLWDLGSGKELRRIKGEAPLVDSLAFAPDGTTVAAVWRDRTVRRYDVATGDEQGRIDAAPAGAAYPAFSPDGKLLALTCADRAVRLWDVTTGKERFALKGEHEFTGSVAFSPDGKTLAAAVGHRPSGAPGPGLVVLWDMATGKEARRFTGRPDYFQAVAFSPDGKSLAAGGARPGSGVGRRNRQGASARRRAARRHPSGVVCGRRQAAGDGRRLGRPRGRRRAGVSVGHADRQGAAPAPWPAGQGVHRDGLARRQGVGLLLLGRPGQPPRRSHRQGVGPAGRGTLRPSGSCIHPGRQGRGDCRGGRPGYPTVAGGHRRGSTPHGGRRAVRRAGRLPGRGDAGHGERR